MTNKIINPIIPGFYPDPSICRAGDDYYIACSSFEMSPGIPLFHSKDLAHWEQVCNVLIPDNGFHMEKNSGVGGIMAPTIRYHNGTFYILCANFSDKGNFIVTAKDPKGPWSAPHWLTDVPGIDASLFFDNDGKVYVIGTGDVWENEGGRMERGIWLAEYDIENFKLKSEPVTIFNSALRGGASPEAPHLYHVGDFYHLIIAEGGTEHYHAVMNARSKKIFDFYERNPANPVFTHRHMGFKSPIINVGHADLVELPDGSWYAVMLASRLIDGECKNLGRETFICPVEWERDWPLFSPKTGRLEWEYDAPECLPWIEIDRKNTRYDFNHDEFEFEWVNWGVPYEDFYKIEDSKLYLQCKRQRLDENVMPMSFGNNTSKEHFASMFAQRQCAMDETVTAKLSFMAQGNESAGLAIIQAMNHQIHVERVCVDGKQLVQCIATAAEYNTAPYFPGFTSENSRTIIAQKEWNCSDIIIQIEMKHEDFTVRVGNTEEDLEVLTTIDGRIINPEKVGCMTGTLMGVFASGNGEESQNYAAFDWVDIK